MILKSGSKLILKKSKNINKFLSLYFFLTFFIGVLFLIFFFTSHTVNLKTKKSLDYLSKAGRIEYIYILDIIYKAVKSNFYTIDRIDIDIKFNDIVILEKERQEGLDKGTLGRNKDNLTKVNATVRHEDKRIKSKIRLKGDRQMHWGKKKNSSYNVYLPKDNYIFGVNNFAIHKPGVRNYIHEWIFNEMMGDLDVIKSQYKFFDLYINGTNNGLYAFEEKMGKEILERNKKRNGPIISTINEFSTNFSENNQVYQVYDEKYWDLPENIELAKTAIEKFKGFVSGERGIEETFDLEKMAAFFAVLDATYTSHALFFNSKLYYNPLSGLFEPIPRDGHRQLPNYYKFNLDYYENILIDSIHKGELKSELGNKLQIAKGGGREWWIKKFFNTQDGSLNHTFYELYLKYLKKISSVDYLDSFFLKRKKEIEKINSKIYSDHFFYAGSRNYTWGLYYFKKDDLYHRAKIIRNRLVTNSKKIKAFIDKEKNLVIEIAYDYFDKNKNQFRLDSLQIEYINCRLNNENFKKKLIQKQVNLFSTTKIKLDFLDLKKSDCKNVMILDKKLNTSYLVEINDLNSFHNFEDFKSNNNNFYLDFFKKKKNNIFLKNKIVKIDKNIYIPRGLNVIINSGQKIILTNNSFIISDSKWIIDGSNEQIFINGLKDNFGGGILIRGAIEKSYFNNVKFAYLNGFKKNFKDKKKNIRYSTITSHSNHKKNLYTNKQFIKNSNMSNYEFNITGSLNFYKTNVVLKNLIFDKIASEDAVNIVNSRFLINDVEFIENLSDSIDFDFSSGSIDGAKFMNIGNDAIDFSGSTADVKNIYFKDVGDKLISVGEISNIDIAHINAEKSYAGIASKDGSIVRGSDITMNKVILPFVSFNKKSEYEPATMHLDDVDLSNFENKWITDQNSSIYYKKLKVGVVSENMIPIIYNKELDLLKGLN